MTLQTTQRPGRIATRGMGQPAKLPEYLEAREVEALLSAAPHGKARLLMLIQWRAGLRVSEALALEGRDLRLDPEMPTLQVRQGKGRKPRIVPVHPELRTGLLARMEYGELPAGRRVVVAGRSTADRWIRAAAARAGSSGPSSLAGGSRVTPSDTVTPGTCCFTGSRSTT